MQAENLEDESVDIWQKNIIKKYEKRGKILQQICLAEFVAWYYVNVKGEYMKRKICKIIRYRHYDIQDAINYKREMVTLFFPFHYEELDILDSNKFLNIFDDNECLIMNNRKKFQANIVLTKF